MFGRHATLLVDINFCERLPAEKYQHYCALDDPDLSAVFENQQQILEEAKKYSPSAGQAKGTSTRIVSNE